MKKYSVSLYTDATTGEQIIPTRKVAMPQLTLDLTEYERAYLAAMAEQRANQIRDSMPLRKKIYDDEEAWTDRACSVIGMMMNEVDRWDKIKNDILGKSV